MKQFPPHRTREITHAQDERGTTQQEQAHQGHGGRSRGHGRRRPGGLGHCARHSRNRTPAALQGRHRRRVRRLRSRHHGRGRRCGDGHSDDNGGQDTGKLNATYDHNWFDGTTQRNPRVRFGNPVHVLNNYFSNIASYGAASTQNAGVIVEGNSFENVKDPYHLGEGSSHPGSLMAKDNNFVNSGKGQTGGTVAPIPYPYTAAPASGVKASVTAGAGVGKI